MGWRGAEGNGSATLGSYYFLVSAKDIKMDIVVPTVPMCAIMADGAPCGTGRPPDDSGRHIGIFPGEYLCLCSLLLIR